jgi:hypothetical protein
MKWLAALPQTHNRMQRTGIGAGIWASEGMVHIQNVERQNVERQNVERQKVERQNVDTSKRRQLQNVEIFFY